MKSMVKSTMLLALFASAPAFAAPAPKIGITPDGTRAFWNSQTVPFVPQLVYPKGLKAISSNLGLLYPKGIYLIYGGYIVQGGQTGRGPQQWLAVPFTPTSAATINEMDVGVANIGGTNGLRLGLYADASGLPGALIKSFAIKNLSSGACCALAVAKDAAGIAVSAGTQYWLGLTTTAGQKTSMNVWWSNSTDVVDTGTLATNRGSGWSTSAVPGVPAYGVFGK